MCNVDGWTREKLTDELARGTDEGEATLRELLEGASHADLVNMIAEADRLRTYGKELQ